MRERIEFEVLLTSKTWKLETTLGMGDYSFKKQGAIPFKWEIKPGVPKHPQQQQERQQHYEQNRSPSSSSSEFPSPKLTPPPSMSYVFSSVEPWSTRSFRSTPPVRSGRWQFDRPITARPNSVPPSGCFLSPFLKRLSKWKKVGRNRKPMVEPEYDGSDMETLSVWSVSSGKLLSPLPSNQSSVVSHAGWVGSGPLY